MSNPIKPLVTSLHGLLATEPLLDGPTIESTALPSIRLMTRRLDNADFKRGASRIGGVPDVPPGFIWPCWLPTKQPAPLGFIAQIDLADLPHVETSLPISGWLYFFYDRLLEPWGYHPADRVCWRVAFVDCPRSNLKPAELPKDLDTKHVANACAVEATVELTLPEHLEHVEFGSPLEEAYTRLRGQVMEGKGRTHHRLLGHPQPIQNTMELECQLASNGVYCGDLKGYQSARAKALEVGATDWRLLLQIDTDEKGPGWMWGDMGRIYYWIKRQDLATRRFEDVWLILQCG